MRAYREWPADPSGLVELYPRNRAPTVRANFIASVDGAVTVGGLSGGLHGPGDKEIFDSLETFYRQFYFRPGKIGSIVKEMVTQPDMMKRRLREGVEFFHFLKDRKQHAA